MRILTILMAVVLFSGCIESNQSHALLAPGIWRAQMPLILHSAPISQNRDLSEGMMPFTFEVFNPTDDSIYIEIINGDERIPVSDITYRHNSQTAHDSIRINFPIYDTYIVADIDGNKMVGFWHVPSKKNYKILFSARHGKKHRFTTHKKEPVMNISGLWPTTFGEGEDGFSAIGSFEQKGNHLNGTFMTETGDFRYLEGTIQADKIYLSAFDGSHAFLFEAKVNASDSTMVGTFRSGTHYETTWTAHKDNHAKLADPEQLVQLKDTDTQVDFSLPTPDKRSISLQDPSLAGKPTILQIMGTWCPNCKDEGAFLADFVKAHPNQSINVIGLAFEKHDDREKNMKLISKYKKSLQIPYDIVLAGKPKRENIFKLLPQLENFVAYPTMIFLDKNRKIVKIHTGFNGPATPEFNHFRKEFDQIIQEITKE